MSGGISASGLITGIDSASIISQLMQIERQPITRMQRQISGLETQRTALRGVNTQLAAMRSKAVDFRLKDVFRSYQTTSSETDVLTAAASGSSPVMGSFKINVIKLASASVATSSGHVGSTMNTAAALKDSKINTAISGGEFSINGVTFEVDPETDSLDGMLAEINASSAGVTATYNASTDKLTIANTAPGNTAIINFGAQDDTSNFLAAINMRGARQYSNGAGSTEVVSSRNLGAINTGDLLNDANLANGVVTAGVFSINGVSISVDPTTDSLSNIIGRINNSDAGVTASYDAASDGLRLQSKSLGSRTIGVGGVGDTSNFLSIVNLAAPTQTTGLDAEFSIDGGPAITRNSNTVTDALGGITLNLVSAGESAVTVSTNEAPVLESVKAFIEAYNATNLLISNSTSNTGNLKGDSGVRAVGAQLKSTMFSAVTGARAPYLSLVDIGFNTGDTFDPSADQNLQLNEETFLKALRADPEGVKALLTNSNKTGIADQFESYLDDATKSTGFINSRVRSNGAIDRQISMLNDRIASMEDRCTRKEERLRKTYSNLEMASANLKTQSASLSRISSGMSAF